VHLTNAEQARDEIHGFGMVEHNVNLVVDPGETKTMKIVADRAGVYPYYCTNFCSALHQEMQGYLEVVPQGLRLSLYDNNQGIMRWERRNPPLALAKHAGHGR
jgi:heme/copper-type cytochrome/quinol oxidase subunit 2